MIKKLTRGVLIFLFWIAVWWLISLAVGMPLLFPTPWAVVRKFGELAVTGAFWESVALSLCNVLLGLCVGIGAAIILVTVTSLSSPVRSLFYPLITIVRATPVASFIVLSLLFLGSEKVPVFIVSLMVMPIVWTSLDKAVKSADRNLYEVTVIFRFSRWQKLIRYWIPSLVPDFVASLRTSVGIAWKAGIAAEILARSRGTIGFAISDAKQYIETEEMFAWTVTVVLLSIAVERLCVRAFSGIRYQKTEEKQK